MTAKVIKMCACGRKYTRAQWARLAFCGLGNDGVDVLEYRHCRCTSTITVVLDASGAVDVAATAVAAEEVRESYNSGMKAKPPTRGHFVKVGKRKPDRGSYVLVRGECASSIREALEANDLRRLASSAVCLALLQDKATRPRSLPTVDPEAVRVWKAYDRFIKKLDATGR